MNDSFLPCRIFKKRTKPLMNVAIICIACSRKNDCIKPRPSQIEIATGVLRRFDPLRLSWVRDENPVGLQRL